MGETTAIQILSIPTLYSSKRRSARHLSGKYATENGLCPLFRNRFCANASDYGQKVKNKAFVNEEFRKKPELVLSLFVTCGHVGKAAFGLPKDKILTTQ